jgi:hypothetical protein
VRPERLTKEIADLLDTAWEPPEPVHLIAG